MSSHLSITVEDSGEVIDQSLDQARSTPYAREGTSVRTGNTVYRNGDAGPSQSSHVSVSERDLAPSASPLDGATTAYGRPIPRAEVDGKSIVNIGGTTMRVMDAYACGLLGMDPVSGRYVDLPAAQPGGEPQPGEQQSDADADVMTSDQHFINALAGADSALTGDLYESHIDAAISGDAPNIDVARVAQALGITEAQAADRVFDIVNSYQSSAEQAVKSAGVNDLNSFWNFCRSARPSMLREAVSRLVDGEGADTFAAIARDYIARGHDAGIDTSEVLEADFGTTGITAARYADGLVYLTIPGVGTVEASAAVRSGLVKVSR